GDQLFGPLNVANGDPDYRAGFQKHRLVVAERAGADLRPLKVLQDADGALFAFSDLADAPYVRGMLFVRAMRKIQARNVHSRPHQGAQHLFIVRRRPNGTDDFGAAVLRVTGRERETSTGGIRLAGFQNWTIQ